MGCLDIFKKRKRENPFRYVIEDVFTIKGRGTVVVGLIESGILHEGDKVTLCRTDGSTRTVVVGGIEKYKQGLVPSAVQGENVGVLLKDISKEEVGKGDCLMA